MTNRRTIAVLIDQAILDGLGDSEVRTRLRACGWNIKLTHIDRRRRKMQERGVPV